MVAKFFHPITRWRSGYQLGERWLSIAICLLDSQSGCFILYFCSLSSKQRIGTHSVLAGTMTWSVPSGLFLCWFMTGYDYGFVQLLAAGIKWNALTIPGRPWGAQWVSENGWFFAAQFTGRLKAAQKGIGQQLPVRGFRAIFGYFFPIFGNWQNRTRIGNQSAVANLLTGSQLGPFLPSTQCVYLLPDGIHRVNYRLFTFVQYSINVFHLADTATSSAKKSSIYLGKFGSFGSFGGQNITGWYNMLRPSGSW